MGQVSNIEHVLSTLFPEEKGEHGDGNGDGNGDGIDDGISHPISTDLERTIYPEQLLHSTEFGNKYYVAFQSMTRQFYEDENADTGSIMQFRHSKMSALLRQKVLFWDDKEHEPRANIPGDEPISRPSAVRESSAASSLFAWSSGDKYIAARKKELRRKSTLASTSGKTGTELPEPSVSAATKPDVSVKTAPNTVKEYKPPRGPNFTHRLTALVESESNRFIQDRIRLIKDHHRQQAAKKIDERRKRDHEIHLRRVQLKEEKYENILKAAIAVQNTKRNSGFFGSLFGPKPISNSFTLEISDAEVPIHPATPALPLPRGKSTEVEIGGPGLDPTYKKLGILASDTPVLEPQQYGESRDLGNNSPSPIGNNGNALLTKSVLVSARSSMEFEDYQSSTDKTGVTNMDTIPSTKLQWNMKHESKAPEHHSPILDDLDSSFLDFETALPVPKDNDAASDLLSL